jgi:hypothetical protein
MQDPESYDRRSEEKNQEWHKTETQARVPDKYTKVVCAIISSMPSTTIVDLLLYYSSSSYSYYYFY